MKNIEKQIKELESQAREIRKTKPSNQQELEAINNQLKILIGENTIEKKVVSELTGEKKDIYEEKVHDVKKALRVEEFKKSRELSILKLTDIEEKSHISKQKKQRILNLAINRDWKKYSKKDLKKILSLKDVVLQNHEDKDELINLCIKYYGVISNSIESAWK
ncbi:MAG: hypothetical protein GQ557_00240 [Mycoplasmataceae bacterium]|nr:hypothetical protein [Mycoplasmataceae bacterium]